MTILRHYLMVAADGRIDALRGALVDLAAKVRPVDGCEGVELYQNHKDGTRFTFIELC